MSYEECAAAVRGGILKENAPIRRVSKRGSMRKPPGCSLKHDVEDKGVIKLSAYYNKRRNTEKHIWQMEMLPGSAHLQFKPVCLNEPKTFTGES